MNKYLFYILIGFILTSCGNSKGTFSIKGQIKQLRGGELYVYSPAPEFGHADTITVMNEEVDYSSTTSAEIPLILVFGNGSEHTVFVAPGQKIKINGDATHLKDLTFEGGESNELYAKFRKESGDKDEKSVAKLAETIIRDNPKSVVSVFLLYRHFYQTANAKKVIELGKVLQESQPDNIMLSQLVADATGLEHPGTGDRAKDFSFTNFAGSKRSLKSYSGRHLLLTFAGNWNTPSRGITFKLKNLRTQFSDSKLGIATVWFDLDERQWQNAMRYDSLAWDNAYEPKTFESKIAKDYNIRHLPTYFLIDKKGKIVLRSTNAEKIEEEVRRLVK